MKDKTVPYTRQGVRNVTLEGQLVDVEGKPIRDSRGWTQHPQQGRVRRLQPYGRPERDELYDPNPNLSEWDARYGAVQQPVQQPGVNVSVNTAAYRPWKEELLISGWKTVGNFFAWPIRLIAGFLEGIIGAASRLIMIALVPALLLSGLAFYQSHKDQPAGETAHQVGKASVGMVGSILGGIWAGIFGEDEPDAKKDEAAASDAEPSGRKIPTKKD
jgi:hypothetical protein